MTTKPDQAWCEKLVKDWLDNDYQISIERLRESDWFALPAPDSINAMEAEWLADSIKNLYVKELWGISFEFKGKPELDKVSISRDTIIRYNMDNSYKYIILTSSSLKFLYYKSQYNDFFLLCGSKNFVQDSYRCSYHTAKLMYYDWADDYGPTDDSKRYLKGIWEKYATKE